MTATTWPLRQWWASATAWLTSNSPALSGASDPDPILHSFHDRDAGCLSGPGHQSIFTGGERTFLSFHAWQASSGCRKLDDRRYLYIAPIFWKDGRPQIGPSLR